MKRIDMPPAEVRAFDRFERFKSQRTGAYLVYRYRKVHGQACDAVDLLATFGSLAEATKYRNALRTMAERMRTDHEWQERQRVWAGLDAAIGAAR